MDPTSKTEYLVGVTIIEARDLIGKDAQGTSDPLVKVHCPNADTQITKTHYGTNNPVWNQSFTFEKVLLNPLELETMELVIEVWDHNALFANELIGYTSVGLSTMYRHINHEFYRVWVPLFNKEVGASVQGKLQISWFIIGPGEKQPAHPIDEVFDNEDQDFDDEMGPDISEAKKKELQEKKKGIYIMRAPKLFNKHYALSINIIKVEGYPEDEYKRGLTTYWSARVMGNTLITTTVRDSLNPIFNCKLKFPIILPILNDKITVKVWVQHSRTSVEFYANVPEIPKPDDSFNISILQGKEGLMPSRWFNLYGTRIEDRSYFYNPSSTYYLEGSSFMGRMLLGMSINSTKIPELMKTSANLARDPETQEYTLIMEAHEICNVTETEGRNCRIYVSFGMFNDFTKDVKYVDKNKSYNFKNKHNFHPMKVNYPKDIEQVPDVIVTLQAQRMFGGVWNVGYFRVKPSELMVNKMKWYKFKSLTNPHSSPGKLLCNLHLTTERNIVKKIGNKKPVKSSYNFHYNLFYSLDISIENKKEESVESKIEIYLAGEKIDSSAYKPSHIPIWNIKGTKKASLSKDLNYEQDLNIVLLQKGWFSSEYNVGEINIPLVTLTSDNWEPRFYQFKELGKSKGKLLAMFSVREFDDKSSKAKTFAEIMNEKCSMKYTADIYFSIMGIRNLISPTNEMKLTFELIYLKDDAKGTKEFGTKTPDGDEEEENKEHRPKLQSDEEDDDLPSENENGPQMKKEIMERNSVNPEFLQKINEDEDTKNPDLEKNVEEYGPPDTKTKYEYKYEKPPTTCPDFNISETFKNIPFPADPLLWPLISVKISDSAYISYTENLTLLFPLINYVDFLSQEEKEYSMKRMENAYRIKKSPLDDSILVSSHKSSSSASSDISSEGEDSEEELLEEEDKKEEEKKDTEEEPESEGSEEEKDEESEEKVKKTRFKFFRRKKKADVVKLEEDFDKEVQKDDPQLFEKYNKRVKELVPKILQERVKDKAYYSMYSDINVDEDEIVTLDSLDVDKQYEDRIREKKINQIDDKLEQLQVDIRKAVTDASKQEVRSKILRLRREKEALENEIMPEDKFWNYQNNDESEFQYGRNVLHDKTLDYYLTVPYTKYEMKPYSEMCFHELVSLDPRIKALDGYQQRILKWKIKVKSKKLTFEMLQKNMQDLMKKKKQNLKNDDAYVDEKISGIAAEFPFDIITPEFMDFIREPELYVWRVYVLRCQNLAAAASSVGIKDRLAGYSANCTATPYLVLTVGDGLDKENVGMVKTINWRDQAQENTLNPDIYQVYEFSVVFPDDWILKVEIKDASGYIMDGLIGYTMVDLEDRFYGNPYLTLKKTLVIYKKIYKKELDSLRKKNNKETKEKKKELEMIDRKIKEWMAELNKTQIPKVPVEFRELVHPDKKQSQGIVEMWVEIFPEEDSKFHPPAVIKPPAKEEYEIRLIIWETKDIPLIDGDHVDIYVKVIFNPNGWTAEAIEKETDVHYNSKDGRGEFNYRMLFPLEIPWEFPRIKIQVYDYGVLGNTIIGENTLDMVNTVKQLRKEGNIQTDNLLLNLTDPEDINNDVGRLKLSMTILNRMEANAAPVGEAWDEPNENPRLVRPTEGRGLGDRFASFGLSLSGWSWPSWWVFLRYFAIIGPMLGVLAMMATILMTRV